MDASLINWTLLAAVSLAALVFGFIEYQAYLLRTEVKSVPGGLRFTAHAFTVQANRSEKAVQITCKNGQYKSQPLAGGEEQIHTGALDLTLPAVGMRIQVAQVGMRNGSNEAPTATGFSSIVFTGSDELSLKAQGKSGGQSSSLQLDYIPDTVANAFNHFAGGLESWIDKLEHSLSADIAAREAQSAKEATQQARAERIAAEAAVSAAQRSLDPLTPAQKVDKAKTQLSQWRQSAGFSGTVTEMRFDAMGEVVWLIDLNPDGLIILHAEKRHFQGNLKGAMVTLLADALEVTVRDENGQEGGSPMATFRVLKGASQETLLLWRKRLSEAQDRFRNDSNKKPEQQPVM